MFLDPTSSLPEAEKDLIVISGKLSRYPTNLQKEEEEEEEEEEEKRDKDGGRRDEEIRIR